MPPPLDEHGGGVHEALEFLECDECGHANDRVTLAQMGARRKGSPHTFVGVGTGRPVPTNTGLSWPKASYFFAPSFGFPGGHLTHPMHPMHPMHLTHPTHPMHPMHLTHPTHPL